ncbi:hypothetical protein ACFV9D_08210 [Streptomyces sp. NPDC059875]|uniref:hypothetical protein n=1 Tax=unclassified Streptomyces TaxID=2593676 RepID=UPI00366727B3
MRARCVPDACRTPADLHFGAAQYDAELARAAMTDVTGWGRLPPSAKRTSKLTSSGPRGTLP